MVGCRSCARSVFGGLFLGSVLLLAAAACGGGGEEPASIRLVDRFDDAVVEATPAVRRPELIMWNFAARRAPRGDAGPLLGASAVHDIEGLEVRDGALVGTASGDTPVLAIAISEDVELSDQLYAIEVVMRISDGTTVGADWSRDEKLDLEEVIESASESANSSVMSPLVPGDETETYIMSTATTGLGSVPLSGLRHLILRPTDVAGAEFAIESVRIVSRRDHFAEYPSGVGWHGLGNIFRETIVTRTPESLSFDLSVPARPWLELNLGTIEDGPVTFTVTVAAGDVPVRLLQRTVSTADRWETVPVDLTPLAGRQATLTLTAVAEAEGTIAYWGTPVVRNRDDSTHAAAAAPARQELAADAPPPRGVIFVLADTLRRDRLPWYGGRRDNAPNMARLANEGTVFTHNVSQGTWTKVSVPTILTSLYPSTHGITDLADRLPASATTLEELFLEAGYATFHTSSVPFTGKLTNLHQGAEVLHEVSSVPELDHSESKTARTYVDRLLAWLELQRDTPFFVFLHAFDPHSPYEPYPPYDTLYTDEREVQAHQERITAVQQHIDDDHMRNDIMPTREELEAAGTDADQFVDTELDWYDASIRAMDVELGRVLQRLEELGRADDTLIVFMSDHGEEFLEHGRHFHGNNAYGEMINVPLMMWWPGVVPAMRIDEVVESINVFPTMLELSRIPVPEQAQGQSLLPLMASPSAPSRLGWRRRPAFAERVRIPSQRTPGAQEVDSYVIVADGWKLIRNTERPEGWPEFELYSYLEDPLDQNDLAASNLELVASLSAELDDWLAMALAARIETDSTEGLAPEELRRLRALGYVQ